MYNVTVSNSEYNVVEVKTNQVVQRCRSYLRARRVVKNLSTGRGFNGFTPAFILNNSAPKNIWPIIDIAD